MSIQERIEYAKRKVFEDKKQEVKELCNQLGIPVPENIDKYTKYELDDLISRLRSKDKNDKNRFIR